MKKTRIISVACILGSLILLAGCQKGLGNYGGQPVRFGAKTSTSPMSKAAYSGEGTFTGGFLTWERINWESSDKVRIASNYAYVQDGGDAGIPIGVHFADYSLTGINTPTDNPKESRATLAPLASNTNGLVWKDGQESGYVFYAVYPCPYYNSNITLGSGDDGMDALGVVKATLPSDQSFDQTPKTRYVAASGAVADSDGNVFTAAQTGGYTYNVYAPDKNIMFLTAAGKKSYASGEAVELEFKPAFTTFEFHITTKDPNGLTIKKVALTAGANEYLAGEYTIPVAGSVSGAAVSAASKIAANQTVSLSFGNDGIKIGDGVPDTDNTNYAGVVFSLLTVPVANANALTLKVTTGEGEVASLPLTYSGKTGSHTAGEPVVFTPGKKYRVNLLKIGDSWKITLLDLDFVVAEWTLKGEDLVESNAMSVSMSNVVWVNVNNSVDVGEGKVKMLQNVDLENAYTAQGYFNINYPTSGTWYITTENDEIFDVLVAIPNETGTENELVAVDADHPQTIKPGKVINFLVRTTTVPAETYIHMYVTVDGVVRNVDSEVRSTYKLYTE